MPGLGHAAQDQRQPALGPAAIPHTLYKHAFERARPSWDNPLLTLTSYSFPNGYTAGATLFYGLLAAYLIARFRARRVRERSRRAARGSVTGFRAYFF